MAEEGKVCYICPSTRYVEDHHLDCQEGKLSPETVPLCKRCHRTYHTLGVEWFDDEYLDKAIEIENRRREICAANAKYPVGGLPLRREDIRRSDYFNKTHGVKVQWRQITPAKAEPTLKEKAAFRPGIEPLPGWEWYWAHHNDPPPPCEMVIYCDGKKVAEVTGSPKRGDVRKIMDSVK